MRSVIYTTSINLPAPGVDLVSLMSPRPPIINCMLPGNLGSVGSLPSDRSMSIYCNASFFNIILEPVQTS